MAGRMRVIDISPRQPPDPSNLPPTLVARCSLIDRRLSQLHALSPDDLLAWAGLRLPLRAQDVPDSLAYLRSPHSERVLESALAFGGRWGRSAEERRIAGQVRRMTGASSLRTPETFIGSLEAVAGAALMRPVRLRTKAVGTRPDRNDTVLRFTPANTLAFHLDTLRQWLVGNADAPAVIRAAVACQFLSCCHPFDDGNGRTARLVANAILSRAGMPDSSYLPLHELFVLSLGGMEIRSRLVELEGGWNAWIAWFADLVDLGIRASSTASVHH